MSTEAKVKSGLPKINYPGSLACLMSPRLLSAALFGSGIFMVPAEIAGAVNSPLLMLAVWVVGGF